MGIPEPAQEPSQRTATAVVVDHLERVILESGLEPGDDLPSEADIAAELGLSRLTVREAIRTLVARGLVDVRQGRRATVAHASAEPLRAFFSAAVRRDPRGLLELLEVRFAIEVSASSLAARHATRADRESLANALAAMREAGADADAFNAADVHFHAVIASASGNRMFDLLVEGMEEPLHASRVASLSGFLAEGRVLDDLVAQHEEIYAAINARTPRAAGEAMRRHLTQTRHDLRNASVLATTKVT
ncbi:FadR/GntR family transcriptional regulator [Microbacterium rhizomatis]|uniref:FadR family transcriptional regulator n=1 Tax=Microbacterium rhizomatis TaxID=1631477 RepID=A0A5J5IYF3_9MICO|nr:FadR/GntR family transcriptional regulator [Microbacterium rhizomatis]KAA9105092.1 FadR family transcriptional regulator [Microbacterium rhizomatis]